MFHGAEDELLEVAVVFDGKDGGDEALEVPVLPKLRIREGGDDLETDGIFFGYFSRDVQRPLVEGALLFSRGQMGAVVGGRPGTEDGGELVHHDRQRREGTAGPEVFKSRPVVCGLVILASPAQEDRAVIEQEGGVQVKVERAEVIAGDADLAFRSLAACRVHGLVIGGGSEREGIVREGDVAFHLFDLNELQAVCLALRTDPQSADVAGDRVERRTDAQRRGVGIGQVPGAFPELEFDPIPRFAAGLFQAADGAEGEEDLAEEGIEILANHEAAGEFAEPVAAHGLGGVIDHHAHRAVHDDLFHRMADLAGFVDPAGLPVPHPPIDRIKPVLEFLARLGRGIRARGRIGQPAPDVDGGRLLEQAGDVAHGVQSGRPVRQSAGIEQDQAGAQQDGGRGGISQEGRGRPGGGADPQGLRAGRQDPLVRLGAGRRSCLPEQVFNFPIRGIHGSISPLKKDLSLSIP